MRAVGFRQASYLFFTCLCSPAAVAVQGRAPSFSTSGAHNRTGGDADR